MRGFFHFLFSKLFLCILVAAAYIAAVVFLCIFVPSLMRVTVALSTVYILSAAVAFFVLSRDIPPEFKCAWLALIAALPPVGAVVYLLVSYRKRGCKRCLLCETPLPPSVAYDRFVYFKDGTAYFDLLFAEIERAKKYIYLEYYIVAKGVIFEKLLYRLKKAKERGVEIKIIIDGLGSALRLPKGKLKELKRAGAGVKIFHKLNPLPLYKLNFRDHRKIAVIDGNAAFIGGINIADEYSNLRSPHGYWKDTGAAFYGDAAKAFSQLFLSSYEKTGKLTVKPSYGERTLVPVYDGPPAQSGFCENAYCRSINAAEKRVWILTPYLCVGDKLKSALIYAAMRGADVKIIIPHIPDKKLTYLITKSFAEELARGGVKIFEYTPGFMHAKTLICDGEAYLGSYNLDYRSMRINFECGAGIHGDDADEIARDFLGCLAVSDPLKAKRKNIFSRLATSFLRLFAPLV